MVKTLKDGTKIKTLARLEDGAKVAIINCVDPGTIIRRVGQNLYEVQYLTHVLVIPRGHLFPWPVR